MAKKKSSPSVDHPGTMLEQKTFQDFNKRQPSLSDPNESKGKENQAGQDKAPVSAKIKKEKNPVPSVPRKSTKRDK